MLPFIQLVDNFEARYLFVTNDDTKFTLLTNKGAPRYKLVRVDFSEPESWTDVVPEDDKDVLETASAVNNNQLLVSYLRDVKYGLQLRDLETGALLHQIPVDIGTVYGISGKREDSDVFIGFTSFLTPGIIYKCNLAAGVPEMQIFREAFVPGFHREDFEVKQVHIIFQLSFLKTNFILVKVKVGLYKSDINCNQDSTNQKAFFFCLCILKIGNGALHVSSFGYLINYIIPATNQKS